MPTLHWALLCERVIADKKTNKLTLVDVVDQASAVAAPGNLPPINLVTAWYSDDSDEVSIRFRFVGPDGKVETEHALSDLSFTPGMNRVHVMIGALPIRQYGNHFFKIDLRARDRWKTIESVPLTVSRRTSD